jgi:hypothetical protein
MTSRVDQATVRSSTTTRLPLPSSRVQLNATWRHGKQFPYFAWYRITRCSYFISAAVENLTCAEYATLRGALATSFCSPVNYRFAFIRPTRWAAESAPRWPVAYREGHRATPANPQLPQPPRSPRRQRA